MGSENHHHAHHYFSHHIHHHRATFLPMLCSRPSIKDVSLPQWKDHSGSFSNDPLSPRIGCMGQVKRHNRITQLLTTKSNTTTTISISPSFKYSKLKKLFSSKNISTTTTNTSIAPIAYSCGIRPQVRAKGVGAPKNHSRKCSRNENQPISIENMDPPLPVIKRVQKPEEEESQVDSLWKRRSGGSALKSLQLQQIHHPRHNLQLTSV